MFLSSTIIRLVVTSQDDNNTIIKVVKFLMPIPYISVLPRKILRHVEVHATLSIHYRKALGGAQGKKAPKLVVELDRCQQLGDLFLDDWSVS